MSSYRNTNADMPNVALAHTAYGDPVSESLRPNATQEGVQQAIGSVFSPYVEPPTPPSKLCIHAGCKGWATKTGYCAGHSRSMVKHESE